MRTGPEVVMAEHPRMTSAASIVPGAGPAEDRRGDHARVVATLAALRQPGQGTRPGGDGPEHGCGGTQPPAAALRHLVLVLARRGGLGDRARLDLALAAALARGRPPASPGAPTLTGREQQAAFLAALGLTDGEIAQVLGGAAPAVGGTGGHATPLTARERQVAGLVARGLSNRAIGAALTITERTAAAHVGNALGKLAFGSRAQLAVWEAAHGLPIPRG
jgi:DNA-binding CsgD family transcriptional regulator